MKVADAYENIEKIITYGFLPLGLRYKGHSFLLKTVTDKEASLLSFLSGNDSLLYALYRLAYSTCMIDGVNYLEERGKQIPSLTKFYGSFPTSLYKVFTDVINDMHGKYLESTRYLEGFCYTRRSRTLWTAFNGGNPNSVSYHGVLGSANTGLNYVQENWIVINKGLDAEDIYETQFRLSLMSVSAFAGKGAKELGGRFDFHKKELEALRDEIRKYGYDKRRIVKEKKKDQWAKPIRTREDLVRELNRQISGEEDRHDLFINRWIRAQKERAEAARRAAEEKAKAFQETVLNDEGLEKIEGSRIATQEDIERLMTGRNNKKPGMAVPSTAYEKSDEKERVLKKLSGTVIRGK